MLCRFQGIARRIEVRGEGTTSLVRADAFAEGVAASVDLLTARVGSQHPPVFIAAPAGLDPIDLDPSARSYKATYDFVPAGPLGAALRVDIEAGAARSGRYQGPLASVPACVQENGCEVQWQDAKRIALLIHPAEAHLAAAAQKGTPIRLTGKFPFVDPEIDPARSRIERLDHIALEGAEGTFACDDGTPSEATGRLVWSAGPDQSLRIEPGILVTPEGLRLTIVTSFAPEQESASRLPWLVGAPVALLVVATSAALFLRCWRRPPVPTEESRAPEPTSSGLVLLAAPSDGPFAHALAKQLRPFGKPVFDPNDPARVLARAELLAETSRAIKAASTVAVLVSADLFSAPEPWPTLFALTMRLRRDRGLRVVPVLCRPFAWDQTELAGLAATPAQGTIGSPTNDEALAAVAHDLAASPPTEPAQA